MSIETDSIFDDYNRGLISEDERDEAIDAIAARYRLHRGVRGDVVNLVDEDAV